MTQAPRGNEQTSSNVAMTNQILEALPLHDARPVDALLVFGGGVLLALDAARRPDLGILASFGDIGFVRYVVLAIALVFAIAYMLALAGHAARWLGRRRAFAGSVGGTGTVVRVREAVSAGTSLLHLMGIGRSGAVAFETLAANGRRLQHCTRVMRRSKLAHLNAGDTIEVWFDPVHPENAYWIGEG